MFRQSNVLVDQAGCSRITGYGLAFTTKTPPNESIYYKWKADILQSLGPGQRPDEYYDEASNIFGFAILMLEVRYS